MSKPRETRPLVQWRDNTPARHLSADDDDPFWFERHELIAMGSIIVIAAGTFLAIYLKTGVL